MVLRLERTLEMMLELSLEPGLWLEVELGWKCEEGAWRKILSNLPSESRLERRQ